MTTIPLHRALAQALVNADLTTMFGLMGDGNLWLIDTFVRDFGGTYVSATHEANAITMASGYARRSSRLAVATVTHGPGLTNTITALTDATRARIPMLVIIGDTPVAERDHSQRLAQREMVLPTGAGFEQVRTPETALVDFHTAIRRALAEERPIVLNIPRPFLLADIELPPRDLNPPARQASHPDPRALDEGLGLLASARRPLILAGRGAADARTELIALADRTGALLATTLQGQALFQGHPFDVGIFGSLASEAALNATEGVDVVLAFGAGLNRHTSVEGALFRNKALIHVDSAPAALGRFQRPNSAILGDAAAVATAMREMLVEAEISGTGARTPELASALAAARDAVLKPIALHGNLDPRLALAAVANALPPSRSVVTDLGRFVIDAWKTFTVTRPEQYVHTNNFGSIGLGMGYAIGATYAAPDEPVVLVTGDGGYMMGGFAELNTAIRYQRNLVVVVVNDAAYGAEHVQFRNRGLDPALANFTTPDLAETARAMGAEAVTIRSMTDLEHLPEVLANRREGPLLLDLQVHPEDVLARGFA